MNRFWRAANRAQKIEATFSALKNMGYTTNLFSDIDYLAKPSGRPNLTKRHMEAVGRFQTFKLRLGGLASIKVGHFGIF